MVTMAIKELLQHTLSYSYAILENVLYPLCWVLQISGHTWYDKCCQQKPHLITNYYIGYAITASQFIQLYFLEGLNEQFTKLKSVLKYMTTYEDQKEHIFHNYIVMFSHVFKGLQYLHSKKIVHGDVKGYKVQLASCVCIWQLVLCLSSINFFRQEYFGTPNLRL